jgi:hypothetical protein
MRWKHLLRRMRSKCCKISSGCLLRYPVVMIRRFDVRWTSKGCMEQEHYFLGTLPMSIRVLPRFALSDKKHVFSSVKLLICTTNSSFSQCHDLLLL